MGFFDDHTKPMDPQAKVWAETLRKTLSGKRKLSASYSLTSSVEEFTRLRRVQSPQRIETVLAWYVAHLGDEFCPQAYSARAFRDKFDQIARACDSSDNPQEEVSEESNATARRLVNEYKFPIEVAGRLPILLERSRKAWIVFRCKMESLREKGMSLPAKDTRHLAFLNWVLKNQSPVFVENWFVLLSSKYGHLPHYSGSSLNLAFKPNSPVFRESFWWAWSQEWCGEADTFDSVLRELLA